MADTLEALAVRLSAIEQNFKNYQERTSHTKEEIFQRLRTLETESGRRDEQYKSIIKELDEQKKQLASIETKIDAANAAPGERWNSLIKTFVSSAVGVLVGYISSKIFGG